MTNPDKEIIKEAFKEWLDEKYAEFGKWTLKRLGAILIGLLLYYAVMHGNIK
jgi:hypothetical protein